jgi:hypothetical protein
MINSNENKKIFAFSDAFENLLRNLEKSIPSNVVSDLQVKILVYKEFEAQIASLG